MCVYILYAHCVSVCGTCTVRGLTCVGGGIRTYSVSIPHRHCAVAVSGSRLCPSLPISGCVWGCMSTCRVCCVCKCCPSHYMSHNLD